MTTNIYLSIIFSIGMLACSSEKTTDQNMSDEAQPEAWGLVDTSLNQAENQCAMESEVGTFFELIFPQEGLQCCKLDSLGPYPSCQWFISECAPKKEGIPCDAQLVPKCGGARSLHCPNTGSGDLDAPNLLGD